MKAEKDKTLKNGDQTSTSYRIGCWIYHGQGTLPILTSCMPQPSSHLNSLSQCMQLVQAVRCDVSRPPSIILVNTHAPVHSTLLNDHIRSKCAVRSNISQPTFSEVLYIVWETSSIISTIIPTSHACTKYLHTLEHVSFLPLLQPMVHYTLSQPCHCQGLIYTFEHSVNVLLRSCQLCHGLQGQRDCSRESPRGRYEQAGDRPEVRNL
jgi:hypothetical protein